MGLWRYTPRPPLSAFVETLWYYNGPSPAHRFDRMMPTGSTNIIINLNEDQIRVYDKADLSKVQALRGAAVAGPQSEYFVIDTLEQQHVAGVGFRPGGAFPFLHPPASEQRNQHVSLDEFWGRAASRLRERLLEARTLQERFAAMEEELLAQVARPLNLHSGVSAALVHFDARCGRGPVHEITSHAELSSRRFVRLFAEQVGYTPKMYCRVRRFQHVLRNIPLNGSPDWADVAVSCGYFDQAHFIHDFRAFSGITPGAYVARHTEYHNHVPLR